MDNTLIVLDSFEYKNKESELSEFIGSLCNPIFVYTKYENKTTEFFQRMRFIGGFFTHISYWLLSLAYSFSLLKYKNINNVIFINPIVGIFYAGIVRILHIKKNITIAGFLFEKKRNVFYYNLRKIMVNFCYGLVNKIIVYGHEELEAYSKEFPLLKNKFYFVQYGKDYSYKEIIDFYYPNKYIASGGRSNRNFETLCDAFEIYTKRENKYDCLVATRPECVTQNMEKSNVKFIFGIVLNQFGSFIKGADFFVLPLKNIGLSAGHMAMMEAMSLKIPVIVTDIPAIRDYVSDEHVFFYKPDDPISLCDTMLFVTNNLESKIVKNKVIAAYNLYNNSFSFKALLRRIVSVVSYNKDKQ